MKICSSFFAVVILSGCAAAPIRPIDIKRGDEEAIEENANVKPLTEIVEVRPGETADIHSAGLVLAHTELKQHRECCHQQQRGQNGRADEPGE